jgi:hypothetical protein
MILVDRGGLPVSRGTTLARDLAERYRKPLLVIDVNAADAAERALDWLQARRRIHPRDFALGVGGPRESETPGIYGRARTLLRLICSWARTTACPS